MKRALIPLILILCGILSTSFADTKAEELLKNRLRNPLLQAEGTLTGEGACWHAAYNIGSFMDEYRSTGDPDFLDAAIQYYDALIGKMHQSPDGYKGWVGPFIYDENYICDVHIGDAILINPMLEFCETVLKNSDENIINSYKSKANAYLELAKKHLIEKWDSRGTWHEDGPYGAHVSWDQYMTSGNLDEWRSLPVEKSNLSLPFNKQNSMGIACLRIYRITGEERYREKALKIFNYMKSRINLFEDHYVWNYWEPFGEWDIDSSSSSKLRHWVNVHPYRNYQSGEVNEIVEAYHSGITFTEEDIQRIINTNINVMWNGDKENPQWRNSNYAVEMAALGKVSIEEAPGGAFTKLAGALWRGLSGFDPTIRELAGLKSKTPVSFTRKYSDLPVTEFQTPQHSNKFFVMTTAIPSLPDPGQSINLISQTRVAGDIGISLYSTESEEEILVIRDPRKHGAGVLVYEWDKKEVVPGEYHIRWTLNGEYRAFPIKIE